MSTTAVLLTQVSLVKSTPPPPRAKEKVLDIFTFVVV
jgi:hypothetical protein